MCQFRTWFQGLAVMTQKLCRFLLLHLPSPILFPHGWTVETHCLKRKGGEEKLARAYLLHLWPHHPMKHDFTQGEEYKLRRI